MRAVVVVVALFPLLSFDVVHNNGEWLGTVTNFADDIMSEVRHTIYG